MPAGFVSGAASLHVPGPVVGVAPPPTIALGVWPTAAAGGCVRGRYTTSIAASRDSRAGLFTPCMRYPSTVTMNSHPA